MTYEQYLNSPRPKDDTAEILKGAESIVITQSLVTTMWNFHTWLKLEVPKETVSKNPPHSLFMLAFPGTKEWEKNKP